MPLPLLARERHLAVTGHVDETWISTLVRAVRASLRVGRREKEHRPALDELTIFDREGAAPESLVEAIGKASCRIGPAIDRMPAW
jgi:hypothetical protein